MFDPTLYGLLMQVEMDKVVLPAMQRPFVWNEDRMIRLVDSLLRGFPLGATLLWKTKTMQRYRRFKKDIDPDEAELFTYEESQDQDRYLVLDGQQRLTTLLIALSGGALDRAIEAEAHEGNTSSLYAGPECHHALGNVIRHGGSDEPQADASPIACRRGSPLRYIPCAPRCMAHASPFQPM